MIQAFAVLLVCQLLGEGVVRALGLPVPGPVIGLMLLAAGLLAQRRMTAQPVATLDGTALGTLSGGLLAHLSLLFVPAGVGIVQQAGILSRNGLALIVALVVSTVLTLIVTAGVFIAVLRLQRGRQP